MVHNPPRFFEVVSLHSPTYLSPSRIVSSFLGTSFPVLLLSALPTRHVQSRFFVYFGLNDGIIFIHLSKHFTGRVPQLNILHLETENSELRDTL